MSLERDNKQQGSAYAVSSTPQLIAPEWEDTFASILRVKAALLLIRNSVQDYLDFAVLVHHLGDELFIKAMVHFDKRYPQSRGESALKKLQKCLENPCPHDLDVEKNLLKYKKLIDKWRDWENVRIICVHCAALLLLEMPKYSLSVHNQPP